MEEDGEGMKLSKRFRNKDGEVDYNTKAGTAWSHSYLNQKPWHPLSYPNQRRKWIAEQTHSQRQNRAEEVSREYAQEQEFFRQTALISKKEKEKMEMMQAVSFMYVRPPGYNAESAKAAEIADERKMNEESSQTELPHKDISLNEVSDEHAHHEDHFVEEKKKSRPRDVFGRALPTEEEFGILKNAPRLETGAPARVKPFGVEIRNVKCLRCGNFGHQSGDRECIMKDVIMPSEQIRLKRDDPLTAILANTNPPEPLKWELKQKPGMSPPRGGFKPDDPNQQIVAEEIFDEYGGFLAEGDIPGLLTNFSSTKSRKKRKSKRRKHKRPSSTSETDTGFTSSSSFQTEEMRRRKYNKKRANEKGSEKKICHPNVGSSYYSGTNSDRKGKRGEHIIPTLADDSKSKKHHSDRRKCTRKGDRGYSVPDLFRSDEYHRSERHRH